MVDSSAWAYREASPPGSSLGKHDPDELSYAQIIVVKGRVHHHFFYGRGQTLGAFVEVLFGCQVKRLFTRIPELQYPEQGHGT